MIQDLKRIIERRDEEIQLLKIELKITRETLLGELDKVKLLEEKLSESFDEIRNDNLRYIDRELTKIA